MRSRFSLTVALLAALTTSAGAGGAGTPPSLPPLPGGAYVRHVGATVPFTVDVNLSRTRTQPGGPLRILVTAITPKGKVVNLNSRPIRAGEKRTWTVRLSTQGTLVIHVLDDHSIATNTQVRRAPEPARLVVTGGEKRDFGVRDDGYPPRTGGICSSSRQPCADLLASPTSYPVPMADPSLGVLTAMITPAVLISGAGTLLLSTSTRLGRTTDRVRQLTARFKELVSEEGQRSPLAREEKRMIVEQLPRLTRRTRYLQRAMRAFYVAVALLVGTSILIGVGELGGWPGGPLPVLLALLGAGGLAYGALLLSFEATLSGVTTREEMRFLVSLGEHYATLYQNGTGQNGSPREK